MFDPPPPSTTANRGQVRTRLVLLALSISLLPAEGRSQVPGGCAASTGAVCYARDVVRSLAAAHQGAVVPDTAGVGQNVLRYAQAIMYAAEQQKAALGDAQRILLPYAAASDSNVRQSATLFGLAYQALEDFQSSSVAELRGQLDDVHPTAVGATAERLAKLQMERRQGAEALIAAVGGAGEALTWVNPATKRATGLTMTMTERQDLLRQLREAFSGALKPRDGQYASDYAAAAVAFRDFLGNPSWKLRSR
jgi:hypothetical protein